MEGGFWYFSGNGSLFFCVSKRIVRVSAETVLKRLWQASDSEANHSNPRVVHGLDSRHRSLSDVGHHRLSLLSRFCAGDQPASGKLIGSRASSGRFFSYSSGLSWNLSTMVAGAGIRPVE